MRLESSSGLRSPAGRQQRPARPGRLDGSARPARAPQHRQAGRKLPRSCQRRRLVARASAGGVGAGEEVPLEVAQILSGQKSPVSGYKPWLPGGGLVHVLAQVDPSTHVEVTAVVQEGARIGRKCRISAGSTVGPGVSIGDKTRIGYQVALERCSIGSHCVLHNGCKIGGRGFVFREEADGSLQRAKEDQAFRAEVRDAVEVGANTVVDRGSWRDTIIDKGCKLDALVHIGHDATLGRACVLCSGASVGASSSLADSVVLGAGAAVRDHVAVAARARVAARSGVARSISAAGDYAGHPAVPAAAFKRQLAAGAARQAEGADEPGATPGA